MSRMALERIRRDEIDLGLIKRSSAQARQTHVYAGLDELASSIRTNGLLDPVHLVEVDRGSVYELVDGQRRFLAYKRLHRTQEDGFDAGRYSKIPAVIYKNTTNAWEKKALSLNANLCNVQMTRADRINAVTALSRRFDSVRAMADATGLSGPTIRKYLNVSALPVGLQNLMSSKGIPMSVLLEASRLYGFDPKDGAQNNVDEMVKVAVKMQGMTKPQRNKVRDIARDNPGTPVDGIVERVRAEKQVRRDIVIPVGDEMYSRMGVYRDKRGLGTVERAAVDLIEDGLEANEVP